MNVSSRCAADSGEQHPRHAARPGLGPQAVVGPVEFALQLDDPVQQAADECPPAGVARDRGHVAAGQQRHEATAAFDAAVQVGRERLLEHPADLRAHIQPHPAEHGQQVAVGGLLRDSPGVEQQFRQAIVQRSRRIERQGVQVFRCGRQTRRKRLPARGGPPAGVESGQQIVDGGVILQHTGHEGDRCPHPEHAGHGRQILAHRLAEARGIRIGGTVHLQGEQHHAAVDRRQGHAGLPQLVAGELHAAGRLAPLLRRPRRQFRRCRQSATTGKIPRPLLRRRLIHHPIRTGRGLRRGPGRHVAGQGRSAGCRDGRRLPDS